MVLRVAALGALLSGVALLSMLFVAVPEWLGDKPYNVF